MVVVVLNPSFPVLLFVVTFRLLVPVCGCSVLLFIVAPEAMNPLVFPRVSVPVCWLGVRRLLSGVLGVMVILLLFMVLVMVCAIPRLFLTVMLL